MNKFEALKLDDDGASGSDIETEEATDENREEPDTTEIDDTSKQEIKFEFPPLKELADGHHQLQTGYCFWFSKRQMGKQQAQTNYEDSIKLVCSFASVEEFWGIYSYFVRPGELTGHCDIHLFKHGIRPMWEDEANKNGGKWIVRLKKGLASRCWENLILAILGEQFMVGSEICGAVVSIRFQEDIISIWNRNASDKPTTARIKDTLKRVLNLPLNTIMEYKAHMDSLHDRSSFRNTNFFVQ